MLTTADVEQKTFSTALRGYDLDEVDDFLDEVVATIRELTDQIETAQQARPQAAAPVTAPEPDTEPEAADVPAPAPTPAEPGPRIDESAIGRALLAAQTAADQLLADAQAQATRIVSDAESAADTLQSEKEAKRAEAEAEIAALAARVNSIRSELAMLAGEVSEKLDDMDAVITGSGASYWETGDGGEVVPISDHMAEEPLDLDSDDSDEPADDSAGDSPAVEFTEGEGDGEGSEGERDHLDEILTGVANDLQFGSGDDTEDEEEDD